MLDGGWLFPGMDPVDPLSTRQLNRVVHAAAEYAQIDKRVTMHTLRHNSARRIIPSTSYRWPDSMANLAVGGVCDSA
jgi:hypothetical protein